MLSISLTKDFEQLDRGPINLTEEALRSLSGSSPFHPSKAAWVTRYENLVVLRTFSKRAGLAGIRVGYGEHGTAALLRKRI